MAALVVPTIFTAVDKITGVVDRMKRSVGGFAGKASIGINALNKGINKLIPSLSGVAKQAIGFARDFAIFTLAAFSFKTILDYEKSLAHLHGILNDLSADAFVPFRMEVNKVAKETQTSASIVADAFTKIAERNINLAKTPESLASVTKAAITLGRAADMELVPSIDGLVNLLYQFNLQGKDANRVINVLAAGKKFGSSNIEEQIEAYKKFGSVAKKANLSLEQSQALIQTVAHTAKGEEAGVGLRNILLYLFKYKEAYDKAKHFNIGVALEATKKHLKSLGDEQKQNIFLQELFGKRTANVALTLLDGIDRYKQLTEAVTGTNEAQKQAAINQDNVSDVFKRMVATYQNYITSNDNTMPGLQRLKDILRYITNNMDDLIGYIVTGVKWFLILKAAIWGCQIVLGAINIAMGIFGAVTGVANIAIGESSIAMGAYRMALILGLGPTAATTVAVDGMAASFVAAEGAASTFFATLSAFVIPAALTALAGYALYKVFTGHVGKTSTEDPYKHFNRGDKTTFGNSFANNTEEQAYQQWWVAQDKAGRGMFAKRSDFDKLHGKEYDNGIDLTLPKVAPTAINPHSFNAPSSDVNIYLHDPKNSVDTVEFTGHAKLHIPVKVTSTTGQGGRVWEIGKSKK